MQWLQELNVDSGTIQMVRGRVPAILDPHPPKTPSLPIFQLFSLFSLTQRISVLEEHLVYPHGTDEKTGPGGLSPALSILVAEQS